YRRRRTLSFLNLWTKIIFTTLILLIAVSFGVKTFFNVTEKSLAESSGNLNLKIDSQKLTELETSAKNFNSVVGQAIAAQSNTKDWSGFFRAWQAAGPDVQVQRMLVKSSDFLVSLSGWVNTQEKMLSFKNKLAEATEYFSDVDIPLASIIQQKNGVEFNLNLKIKKLP
ncbi:MAG TPA: hypothetical protein PKZ02_00135, partial [Candidatus Paceibacterota bacterium]|nr:hypothetical protein [Candidatus Paceibacterota bacterium]